MLEDDGENYETWYTALTLAFTNRGIWSIVNGTEPCPTATSDPTGHEEWCLKDREAQLMILLALKKVGQKCVFRAKTSKEYWDRISSRYSGAGGGNERTVSLLEQFFFMSFKDAEPMQPQVDRCVYAAQQLETVGFPIAENLLAFLLAMRLPESYSMLRTVLTNSDASTITSRWVADRIIGEEQHRLRNFEGTAAAFYAKASKGKGKSPQADTDLKCSHCKKKGHKKSECRKLKKEKAEQEAAKNSNATSGSTSGNSNPASSSSATAKIAVASDPPANGSTSDADVIRLFHAVAIPRSAERLSTTRERVLQAKIDSGPQSLEAGWIIDSGASRNMCAHRDWFHHYSPLVNPMDVVLGDDSAIQATGVGRISVRMHAEGKSSPAVLQDVLHVPELHGNLLSVSHFAKRGSEMRFVGEGCSILDQHKQVACEGDLRGSLYVMRIATLPISESAHIAVLDSFPAEGEDPPEAALIADNSGPKASVDIWHRRLGHLNTDDVIRMARKGMTRGMEISGGYTPSSRICEPCVKGKQTRAEIRKETDTRSDLILGRVFSDVCTLFSTRSHQGFAYFVTWIDDKSRKVFVDAMKEKSEVAQHLRAFVARVELETGHKLKVLRSDGGGEYTAGGLQSFLKDKGIKHELTTADTPQHNGVAERMNRTLVERVRTMLIDAELPDAYWWDALRYATHLHNVSPTRSLSDCTPEESWSGNKPDVSRLRVFGCKAFVHIPDKLRGKLSAKSLVCTFIGYAQQRKAYRLVHRQSKRFIESRDVIFDEGGTNTSYERVILDANDTTDPLVTITPTLSSAPVLTSDPSPSTPTSDPSTPTPVTTNVQPTPVASRPKRTIRPPVRDDDPRYSVTSYSRPRPAEQANVVLTDETDDPRTYEEAMARSDAAEWDAACEDEIRNFQQMGVYDVVPRPKGRKVVGSKWVLRIKRGPDGQVQKYKARIVAQGFTQVEGLDYDQTFAPVVKLSTFRAILAIAVQQNLTIHQMDVKAAYLNGKLKEEIYMEAPTGLEIPEGMVLRLNRAVYGTKQGGRVWYEDVCGTMAEMGYTRIEADHAVFIRRRGDVLSIIALYVDDFKLVGPPDSDDVRKDKETLKRKYNMTDLGEISWILGIHVTRDREEGWIALSQQKYLEEVLERFNKANVRPISTPSLPNHHLVRLPSPEVDTKHFQRALGALMYLMLGTRPDIAYSVAALGRHAANPGIEHQHALDRLFRYLRGSSDYKLVYRRGTPGGDTILGYVDADWGSDVNDRKSTSGYAFTLSGGAISWSSKKQSAVALSSTEAEYIAGAHAAKEAIWLGRLFAGLQQPSSFPIPLLIDNQSAIAIAKNPEFHDRTKHIDIRYHFLRHKVESGDIILDYVPTNDQSADVLTKGLAREKHERFSRDLGLRRAD